MRSRSGSEDADDCWSRRSRVDPGNRCTPFQIAAEGGHGDLVDDFLTGGAWPNSRTRFGRTPLHLYAGLGDSRVVSTLLGDASTHMDALDNDGFSPLMLASRNGHRSTVEVLLRAGADTTPRATDSGEFSHMAALDVAAAQGHVGVIKALLGNGGDASAVDDLGCTALHYANRHKHGGEVVDVLLDAGVDVNAKTENGSTPLLCCALRRHDEAMVALVKRGGNVNEKTNNGMSVLHWVCVLQQPGVDRVVGLLLRWGALETALDNGGKTPSDHLELAAALFAGTSAAPRNSAREEIQRALALLARAPADRTWRRRCWLVVLRARAGRERETRSSSSSTGSDRAEAIDRKLVDHDEDDGSNKVGTDAGGSGSGPMDGERGGAGRTKRRMVAEEGVLTGLVPALLDMKSEGVFRTIVCFL
ncbi:unnamed protein product [Ectocarpus sp. 8 AP-2014]